MKEIFGQHHKLTESELNLLWDTCIFALDANVLLNIYRYGDSTREDLFSVLQGLGGRVWIPYQAAKEFYKNRIGVILDQRSKYDQLELVVEGALRSLSGGEFSKSDFLQLDEIKGILTPAIVKAKALIEEQRVKHPKLLHDDPYLDRIVSIVGTSIGSEPDLDHFEKSCKRAQIRIDKQQPPGYRDAKKPEPERFGDVLIWFELIELGKSAKKPIILVTDDAKEDWWQNVEGKKLGPRPELREEMRKEAGVEFHLTAPEHFLRTVANQLNLRVDPSSLEDAAKVAAEIQEQAQARIQIEPTQSPEALRGSRRAPEIGRIYSRLAQISESAVLSWLLRQHLPIDSISPMSEGPFDFLMQIHGGRNIGIDIAIGDRFTNLNLIQRLRQNFLRAHFHLTKSAAEDYWLFIVVLSKEKADYLGDLIPRIRMEPRYTLSVGFLRKAEEFEEVQRFTSNGKRLFPSALTIDFSSELNDSASSDS